MSNPERVIRPDKAQLSAAIAERLAERIRSAIEARSVAHIVLTGGSMGGASVSALANVDTSGIDWSKVHLWWGDERYVPAGDAQRNETEFRNAWPASLAVPEANIHPMAPSDDPASPTVEDGATRYAGLLAEHAADGAQAPAFDVLMLGVGPDAHIASLFPRHPAQHVIDVATTAVHDSPKPPPTRISLTFPAINHAREVWFMVAGPDKAAAVASATGPGATAWDYPAAGAHGSQATVWWLDSAAATSG